jgi:uncharacterized delta-60 repeat protein
MTRRRLNGLILGLSAAALFACVDASAGLAARATSATGLAIDSKGRIVVAGTANGRIALARYRSNGQLDHSFGKRGRVTSKLARPVSPGGRTVAIDSRGRIVVAGNRNSAFAAVRFNANGTVDRSFGKHGVATRAVPGTKPHANALTVTFGGKIVVAGSGCETATGTGGCFAVARFNSNGAADGTFGSRGLATTHVGLDSGANSVIVAPTGQTFAAGFGDLGTAGTSGFALVRYDGRGGSPQSVVTQFPGSTSVEAAQALGFDPHGNIFLAGSSNGSDFALARYDRTNLNIDPAFGGTGTPTTDLGGPGGAGAVTVDVSGKPLLAGLGHNEFALARYTIDGTLDKSFGSGGLVFTDVGPGIDYARSAVIDSRKRIVVAGASGAAQPSGLGRAFALVRYLRYGRLDVGFGRNGLVTTGFPRH